MKRFFRLTTLAVLALVLFAGCKQDTDDGIHFLQAVDGTPSEFIGTWINDDYGYHSEYVISESYITDAMGCKFNVVSTDTVESTDGYTLVFTQCARGTTYTPAGNYYAVALKLSGENLLISCPIDYTDTNTSLEQLTEKYTSNYDFADSGNWTTNCEKKTNAISIEDTTYMSCKVKFESNKVTLYQMGSSAYTEYSYATFTPVRDTSKESGNTLLYLYSSNNRSQVADLLYVKISSTSSGNKLYYYLYDEEEDDIDYMVDSCNNFLPAISDADVAKIKALYN